MFENIELLKKFINDSIMNYENETKILKEQNSSSLDNYKDEIIALRNNIESIVDIDLNIFKEIISESSKTIEEKERLFEFIKSMKILLELNKKENTTFKLTRNQIEELSKLYDILDEININEQNNKKRLEQEIDSIKKEISKLRKILNTIEDQNNNEFIKDINTIVNALNKYVEDEEEKRKILFSVMSYNDNCYNNKISTNELIPLNLKRLDIDDVRSLFKTYGYDFDQLKDNQKEDILIYGDLVNMQEVFECLKNLRFPKFIQKKQLNKLVILLINSDKKTLTDIVNHSKSKGIYPTDLLSVIPALIEQNNMNGKPGRKSPPGPPGEDSPIIQGKSKDYKDNIDFLSALGFDVADIVKRCPHSILINHVKLVNNYGKFLSYGFKFDQTPTGELTHPAFTFLVSNNFDVITDQFIESGPYGYEYIKDNMSRVSAFTSPDDLVFYNIYASYMDEDYLGRKMIPDGPFVIDNGSKLKLRGEITRLSAAHRDNAYRGIQKDNKQEVTMTIDPPVRNKEQFDKAVNEYSEYEIEYISFDDERLKELDKYIDSRNPLRYDFDGLIISKLKVQRIFYILEQAGLDNLEDSLLYAITYNTIINQENFDKIKKLVKNRSK